MQIANPTLVPHLVHRFANTRLAIAVYVGKGFQVVLEEIFQVEFVAMHNIHLFAHGYELRQDTFFVSCVPVNYHEYVNYSAMGYLWTVTLMLIHR